MGSVAGCFAPVLYGSERYPMARARSRVSSRKSMCSSLLGQALLCVARSFRQLVPSDCFSSQVHPAASYAATVKKNGGKVAVFNLAPSQGDDKPDFVFYGPCEETVPALLERAKQMVAGTA